MLYHTKLCRRNQNPKLYILALSSILCGSFQIKTHLSCNHSWCELQKVQTHCLLCLPSLPSLWTVLRRTDAHWHSWPGSYFGCVFENILATDISSFTDVRSGWLETWLWVPLPSSHNYRRVQLAFGRTAEKLPHRWRGCYQTPAPDNRRWYKISSERSQAGLLNTRRSA